MLPSPTHGQAGSQRGLFLGLATLDIIYLAASPLAPNAKQVAQDYQLSPGGPATNAAVTFAQLSSQNEAKLAAVIGQHPLSHLIRSDAERWNVQLHDLASGYHEPPSLSSIVVNAHTGERSIISINAQRHQVPVPDCSLEPSHAQPQLSGLLNEQDILLIDGHQMDFATALAPMAQKLNIPVVVDGGSWKAGLEAVLAATDYAICSADFRPPGCHSEQESLAYLQALGVPHIAFSHGEGAIAYWQRDDAPGHNAPDHDFPDHDPPNSNTSDNALPSSQPQPTGQSGEIAVPKIKAIDTLGAGDIFHGAFCHYILSRGFPQALEAAAAIASHACQSFGTRSWLESDEAGDFDGENALNLSMP